MDGPVGRLHDVRDRATHHEPLFKINVAGRLTDLVEVASLIEADLGRHLVATSTVTSLLNTRP